ncbi:MAG: hypothetical protein HOY79_22655 [Streptomyces sp.]|nr:hypothetical protein [Streptomyces sp.]
MAATPIVTSPGGCPTAVSQPMPKDFPANLPVPDGALVTSMERRSGDRLVVAMVVRSGFDRTLAFLQKQFREAGYTLRAGEVGGVLDVPDGSGRLSCGGIEVSRVVRMVLQRPGEPTRTRLKPRCMAQRLRAQDRQNVSELRHPEPV